MPRHVVYPPPQRRTDAVSAWLTAALVLSLLLVVGVSILFLLNDITAASLGALVLLGVLVALGLIFVNTGDGGRRPYDAP